MKKIILLLLTFSMCFSLVSCKDKKEISKEQSGDIVQKEDVIKDGVKISYPIDPTTKKECKTIEFLDSVIIAEDENIKIELVNFYEKSWASDNVDKYVTFKCYNKSANELTANLREAYINDEGASIAVAGGTGNDIASNKSKNFVYIISKSTGSVPTPLDNLEDLYKLDGTFEVYFEDNFTDTYKLDFSVADVANQ